MKQTEHDYTEVIKSFNARRIVVTGDVMVDVYLKGQATRLCPEAPVPVIDVTERTAVLGGAANTACNLRALGASVSLVAVVGGDAEGDEARSLLQSAGIDTSCVIRDPDRRTLTKSRIVAGNQIVTRVDQGSQSDVPVGISDLLTESIRHACADSDALIISDYGKGTITSRTLGGLVGLKKAGDLFVAVDSKRLGFFKSLRASCVKPNYEEAVKLLEQAESDDRVRQIRKFSGDLHKRTGSPLILVTLDKEGAILLEKGTIPRHFATRQVAQPYVSGAGDTFISAFVLSRLATSDAAMSTDIATAAATLAVQKEGTTACAQSELRTFFNLHHKYIDDLEDLGLLCEGYRAAGKTIVFTNGCFDILHSGHVSYLQQARQMGDVLIAGVNTDDSIRRIKGPDRPINGLAERIQVLAGLSCVDHVVAFGGVQDDTPIRLIRTVRPNVFVKGGDYTRETLPEASTVEAFGGRIAIVRQIPDHSTSRIISRIRSTAATIPD